MQGRVVYHQNAVIIDNVARYIRDRSVKSLLDIGAGSPEKAVPLSRLVSRYHAIEQDARYAARLKDAGVSVTCGTFPTKVDGTYDLVLSSHSVPEHSVEPYGAFLSSAWQITSSAGLLLVVTFKGNRGDITNLAQELLDQSTGPSEEYNAIMRCYQQFGGTVQCERVNSYAEASRAEDIASFFAPWLSEDPHVRERIHCAFTRIVEMRYKIRDDLFVFPTEHLFLSCRKH
jgi:hypothetical protein